jgi:uncharacterized protein (DUF608 family)
LHLIGCGGSSKESISRSFNGPYSGPYLNRVAFPLGGIGAGMVCLEGCGAISHVSVRNRMDVFNEPMNTACICIKGEINRAKVLEGPVPDWRVFGSPGTGRGGEWNSSGFPRFDGATFYARFPFGTVRLEDADFPLEADIIGWSPFIPGNADDSSLPVGALEYIFRNRSGEPIEAVFSYHSINFMGDRVLAVDNGYVLYNPGSVENPEEEGAYAVFTDEEATTVDHCWFKGGWKPRLSLVWRNMAAGELFANSPVDSDAPGASLFVPLSLSPGESRTVRVMLTWHVPKTDIRHGRDPDQTESSKRAIGIESTTHTPWYAGRFKDIRETAAYWRSNYDRLRRGSKAFRDAFYDSSLPPEVIEAAAANLTILKSPTVHRQVDGRLWCYEGCNDESGCCHGSCTHVWNYAQAIPHLFPELERSLRETEFGESQDARGHQIFRSALPIRPTEHEFYAAADGQLGGIMKVHREWRISGDDSWLESMWPSVKRSLDYCIETWDPRGLGVLEEPHHNTYDIEFWGPDGMCTSFYLGALTAAVRMGEALGKDVSDYDRLLGQGIIYLETELYNGEYFYQEITTEGLSAEFVPLTLRFSGPGYTDLVEQINSEGPLYQYGTGYISDGVIGFWMAHMCGIGDIVDDEKVRSNLRAIYKYNLKRDLSDHPNPQRPTYALGSEGGLLLCSWPRGGELTLPFVYAHEVWTGIEYQVAAHLMIEGMVDEGLDIVRTARLRYDGRVRNPFNEYECGHWYARAMSSYGLIQGLTGIRYDAVEKALYIDSRIGDSFRSFLATDGGFGTVGLKRGKPFVEMKSGDIEVKRVYVSGEARSL